MTEPPTFDELLRPHLEGEARQRLATYAALLERWGTRHSLVRWHDRRELVERHLVESLAARPWLGGAGTLVDVGSGAGLPGVPLLVACPGWRGELLEPRAKRWAFLRQVIRELALDAVALRRRYEDHEGPPGGYDVVTARALGGYPAVLEWSRPRLRAGGRVLLWTTDDGEDHLRSAPGWRVLSSPLPGLEHGRLVSLEPCFT